MKAEPEEPEEPVEGHSSLMGRALVVQKGVEEGDLIWLKMEKGHAEDTNRSFPSDWVSPRRSFENCVNIQNVSIYIYIVA